MQRQRNSSTSMYARQLLDIFMNNYTITYNLPREGWKELSESFGYVPEEDRAEVFEKFLSLLDDVGIPYNKEEFQIKPEEEEEQLEMFHRDFGVLVVKKDD